jgi:hypothetical protein
MAHNHNKIVVYTLFLILVTIVFTYPYLNSVAMADVFYGTDGNDALVGTSKDDLFRAGFGNDNILGKSGDDIIYGSIGNDSIIARHGDDLIYPGQGVDIVDAGAGDDKVIILDLCEINEGKILDGGKGDDMLITPVPLAELQERGLTITNFEDIIINNTQMCESDCTLPCSRVPDSMIGIPDPSSWSIEPTSGLHYRRMTGEELRINNFSEPTWLIETSPAFIANLKSGATPATPLIIPYSDTAAHPVQLGAPVDAIENITKITREFIASSASTYGKLVSSTTNPVIYEYMPDGFTYGDTEIVQDAFFYLLAGDGIYGNGIVQGREISVSGTNVPSIWYIDPNITAGDNEVDKSTLLAVTTFGIGEIGAHAWNHCQTFGFDTDCNWLCSNVDVPCGDNPNLDPPTTHCSDGIDNDQDGHTDLGDEECVGKPAHCSFPDPELRSSCWGTQKVPDYKAQWESGKSFALFAEGQFCSSYPYNWTERLFSIARYGQELFNSARSLNSNFPVGGELSLRFMAAGCWIFPGTTIEDKLNAAIDCNQYGNCGTFQDVEQYPYANKGSLASGYYNNVWNDVHHASTYSTSSGLRDVIHLAQTIYYHGKASFGLYCSGGSDSDEEGTCCGARGLKNFSDANLLGASVAQYLPANNHLPKICDGGERDNRACEDDIDCPGGGCPDQSQVCNGGVNDTLVCNDNNDCPSGFCTNADSPISGNCVTYQTIAHEIGHAMGLQHDGSFIDVCNEDGFCSIRDSFMHSPAGGGPILNSDNQNTQADCLKRWDCPRPGGFKWDGDTCEIACQ